MFLLLGLFQHGSVSWNTSIGSKLSSPAAATPTWAPCCWSGQGQATLVEWEFIRVFVELSGGFLLFCLMTQVCCGSSAQVSGLAQRGGF